MHMHISRRTKPESDSATPCYGASIRKASRIITRIYDDALAASGLNLTQFSIAYLLNQNRSATISDLAVWMDTDKTAMGRNLFPLERDGLVIIRPGKDRRSREVVLTATGRGHYKKAVPLWKLAQKRVEELIGQKAAAELRDLLHLIAAKSEAVNKSA